MTKKNRNKKNVPNVEEGVVGAGENPIETDQSTSNVDAEVDAVRESLIEAEQTAPETESSDVEQDRHDAVVENPQTDTSSGDVQTPEIPMEAADDSAQDDSMDDILADVRQSLMEEDEAGKSEKKSSWWNRLVKGTPNQETPATAATEEVEEDVPVVAVPHPVTESDESESAEDVGEIDELIKLLETDVVEDQEAASDSTVQAPPSVEQEVKIDVEELKKQAFSPRTEEEKAEDFSDVRQVALAGEEGVFVEVESKAADPWEERIKAVENAFRPYRTYIYYGLALIGVVMAVMASILVFNGVKQSLATPEPTPVINLPYPTTLSLPGGLNFSLAKGSLKDGSWDPRGPEWLEGTEICRWVAIPWSRQLEAAVRTLTPDDVLMLLMSNNDKLSYKVESIQELTPAELQAMDSSSPCLALILAKQDSEKRWVAIGRP